MTDVNDERRTRADRILKLSRRVNRADEALEKAISERDAFLIESHGERSDGRLSYDELARATGSTPSERISKGRVIQITQGKSEFSKAQTAKAKTG